jgi:hypothetical protein
MPCHDFKSMIEVDVEGKWGDSDACGVQMEPAQESW